MFIGAVSAYARMRIPLKEVLFGNGGLDGDCTDTRTVTSSLFMYSMHEVLITIFNAY